MIITVYVARPGMKVSEKQIQNMIDTHDPTVYFNAVRNAAQVYFIIEYYTFPNLYTFFVVSNIFLPSNS